MAKTQPDPPEKRIAKLNPHIRQRWRDANGKTQTIRLMLNAGIIDDVGTKDLGVTAQQAPEHALTTV